MNRELKQMVQTVWLLLGIFAVIGILIIWLWIGGGPSEWDSILKLRCFVGYMLGELVAAVMFWHMAKETEYAVSNLEPEDARKRVRASSALRMIVVFFVLVCAYKSGYCHLVALIAGVLCLKPAIHLQAPVYRLLMKLQGKPPEEVVYTGTAQMPEGEHEPGDGVNGEELLAYREEQDDDIEKSGLERWLERKYGHGNGSKWGF